ncbi:MAG: glycosyltransferase [Planctomycetota bacterium]
MTTRIAYVIPTLVQGGAEKQLSLLVRNLPQSEFEPRVFILTHDGPLSDEVREAGIPVELIGKSFKADPTALWRLSRQIKKFDPQIMQSSLFAANSFGRVAAMMAGVPIRIASERCVDHWKTPFHFWIDRRLASRSAAMTTNSQGVVEFYSSHGIDEKLFEVIPNAIEPSRPPSVGFESREAIAERLGVDPERHWILAVGRLWHQKRYRDLIWAAELLSAMRGDTQFLICGDGPQRDELLRFRDSVSKPEHVKFLGHREDISDWRHEAFVFWNGSEAEGQSNSILESMLAGVPVVASNIPGNRDLIEDRLTGRLVTLGEASEFAAATHEWLEDPKQANAISESAKKRIRSDFTTERMVERYAALYRRLLQN